MCLELVLGREKRKKGAPAGRITGNLGAEWSGLTFSQRSQTRMIQNRRWYHIRCFWLWTLIETLLEITFHLGKYKNEIACPKHKKKCANTFVYFKISSKQNTFPSSSQHLPWGIPTQKYLSNVLSKGFPSSVWEILRSSGSKGRLCVMYNLWYCFGSMKYSYLCNFVLYNPHSFIFPWLTGNGTNYAVGREERSDRYDDFVNSGVFDCKLFP